MPFVGWKYRKDMQTQREGERERYIYYIIYIYTYTIKTTWYHQICILDHQNWGYPIFKQSYRTPLGSAQQRMKPRQSDQPLSWDASGPASADWLGGTAERFGLQVDFQDEALRRTMSCAAWYTTATEATFPLPPMRYQEANDRSPAAAHAWPAKSAVAQHIENMINTFSTKKTKQWWSLWKNAQHLPLIIHCDTRKR